MPEARLQRARDAYDYRLCERCGRQRSTHLPVGVVMRLVIKENAQALADEIDRQAFESFYAQ
jgi:hypothetical protein